MEDSPEERRRSVYETMERLEGRVEESIEKAEKRVMVSIKEKLEALRDLVNSTTTARQISIDTELQRIEKTNTSCSTKCELRRGEIYSRLKEVEQGKVDKVELALFKTEYGLLVARVVTLEDWKKTNWQRILIYLAVASVAAVKVLEWIQPLLKSAEVIVP